MADLNRMPAEIRDGETPRDAAWREIRAALAGLPYLIEEDFLDVQDGQDTGRETLAYRLWFDVPESEDEE